MMTDPIQLAAERIKFQEKNTRLRARLLDMLAGPYEGTAAWAVTAACLELDHPRIRGERDAACYCGRVKP